MASGHRNFSPTSERLEPRQMLAANVVINEIHYDPDVKTDLVEFVELYNAGDDVAVLTGWHIADGVGFEFSPGTSIPVGGYLVIAQDPADFNSKFGRTALGPYLGRLSTDGEQVELRDAANVRQDVVDYQLGFPWPTVGDPISADGDGHSIQLVHPSLDNDLGGSWRSAAPTPGTRNNGVFSTNAAPQMRQVDHSPNQPVSGEDVTITVKVTDPDGVASVSLFYQLVEAGDYIEIGDARYRTPWTEVAMNDAGTGDDEIAGDDVFTAVLPGALQTHRLLVRYRITAEDSQGASITGPYADDPTPNFAYYVYDGVPDWTGSIRPGVVEVTYGSDVLNSVATYQLITRRSDHQDSQHIPGSPTGTYGHGNFNWQGTLVYDGVVYDHIRYRVRGGVWRFSMGKNMWKFDFNRGRYFQARDDFGRKYNEKWDKLNFSALIQQGNYLHRGEQGLFERVGFKLFNLVGVASPNTNYVHFRIVESDDENSNQIGSSQYNTDFQGLYLVIEQPDGRLLKEHDLPDGNFYKMEGGTGTLNNQGPNQPSDRSDLDAFLGTYNSNNPTPSERWWRDNFDLEGYYSYRTIVEAIHHYDIAYGKNYFYYHNPETDKWSVLPWDLDLTWADNMFGNGNHAFKSKVTQRAEFSQEYRNRLREIMDLLYNAEQTGMLIDETASLVYTPGEPSLVDADRAMWDFNPILSSGYVNSSKAGHGRFYQQAAGRTFAGMVQLVKNYVNSRSVWMTTNLLTDRTAIPDTPTVTYTGEAGFPVNGLTFETSAFGGNGSFAAMEWRIAEITDPNAADFDPTKRRKYEIEADWESGELTSFDNAIAIPAGNLDAGDTYRVRVRMKDNTGRWSHWSEPVQFVARMSTSSPLIDGLRITEVHYNPPGPIEENDQFEFIELQNIGDQTVDLTGVELKDGVRFQFAGSEVTSLNPGDFVLVVRNRLQFEARYGLGLSDLIAGEYARKLNNDGEQIELVDVDEGTLQKFDYKDGWYKLTDGIGFSLTRVDPSDVDADLNDSAAWRPSGSLHGTPGAADAFSVDTYLVPAPGAVVINEVLAHSDEEPGDWIELLNTTDAEIDIGGWFLSDGNNETGRLNPLKYEIPSGSMIPAGGFATFTQLPFDGSPVFGSSFALSELGDDVVLQAVRDGKMIGFRAREDFGANENGVTLGRTIKSTKGKDFVAMENATFGAANSDPLVGPVVIHEIMYDPGESGGSEFVELMNISHERVELADWHFDAIDFTFGPFDFILPGELIVVVPTDPAEFRATHNVPDEARLFGPYDKKLNNDGESLRLNKPGEQDGDFIPSIMVDRVSYSNEAPWPVGAGDGVALQRITPEAYGNEPQNWGVSVSGGTPGDFLILPTVNEVLVSASDWSPAMLDRLSTAGLGEGGFSMPAGTDQLQTIAWTRVDRLSIRFSEHVDVSSGDLQVAGVNLHEYRIIDFQYDRPSLRATWTLARPVEADKLLVELNADVRDQSGLPLDGNWTNAVSVFPSGNGAIDSDGVDDDAFRFRINVVTGDVTGDGSVDRADLVDLIHSLGSRNVTADSLRRDLSGDGRVDVFDLRDGLLRQGATLPTAEPGEIGSVTPQAAVDAVFARAGGASPGRLVLADPFDDFNSSSDTIRGRRARVDSRLAVFEDSTRTIARSRTASSARRASHEAALDQALDAESTPLHDRLASRRRRNRV